MAVDSRAAAPQNDATAGRTCARARPRERCRAQASRRTGLAAAHWCADAAQQQLARRPGGALRSTRQEKATPCAPHRGISVGVPAHVITAIAPRSDGLSRSTHVQIASRVTALLRLCAIILSRVSRCVSWRPQRCGCQSKFKAFWTRCVPCAAELCDGSAAPGFFALFFFIAAISRRQDASHAIHYATSRIQVTSYNPETPRPRRQDAVNDTRAYGRRRRQPHPSAPGCPRCSK